MQFASCYLKGFPCQGVQLSHFKGHRCLLKRPLEFICALPQMAILHTRIGGCAFYSYGCIEICVVCPGLAVVFVDLAVSFKPHAVIWNMRPLRSPAQEANLSFLRLVMSCSACPADAAEDLYAGETTAQYVFGRLAREGRHSELLSLPDPFNQDLHTWLLAQVRCNISTIVLLCPAELSWGCSAPKDCARSEDEQSLRVMTLQPNIFSRAIADFQDLQCCVQEQGPEITELRWLHELRMRDYGRAAATLARSAVAAGGGGGDGRRQFARCGRAARLAKLALLAGQPGGLVPPSQQVGPPRVLT